MQCCPLDLVFLNATLVKTNYCKHVKRCLTQLSAQCQRPNDCPLVYTHRSRDYKIHRAVLSLEISKFGSRLLRCPRKTFSAASSYDSVGKTVSLSHFYKEPDAKWLTQGDGPKQIGSVTGALCMHTGKLS